MSTPYTGICSSRCHFLCNRTAVASMLWLVLWTGHNGSLFFNFYTLRSIFKIASMCLLFDETFNLPECDFYILSVKPSSAASSQVVCKIACCSHITLTWYSLLPPAPLISLTLSFSGLACCECLSRFCRRVSTALK